jgi:hypothetical protein
MSLPVLMVCLPLDAHGLRLNLFLKELTVERSVATKAISSTIAGKQKRLLQFNAVTNNLKLVTNKKPRQSAGLHYKSIIY